MVVELALPGRRVPAPKPPSYLASDMAFGVGAGTVLGDKSRYRSHGAITGADWAAGVHGYCLDFTPATDDRVVIPAAHTQLNFIAEDFSIIMRVNSDTVVATAVLLLRGRGNADGYQLTIDAGGRPTFNTFQLAAFQTTSSPVGSIVAGTWYTIGISRNGASVRVYRNGVDISGPVGVHIDPLTCARSAKIGIWDDEASFELDGRIEFLRIWRNIALPLSSHLAWHNALA